LPGRNSSNNLFAFRNGVHVLGEMMTDDMDLLREYATSDSQEAFEALVSRHINLVYSVALRQVRDPHLAQEVTQAVFIILARKATSLGPKTILSGWLYRTAQFASADALKAQRRRQMREQEAYMQSTFNEPAAEPDAWLQIAPLLEPAMAQLDEKDRNAIVLRFFGGNDLKTVGAALGVGEDSARMRINRGLEKLRKFFAKRGVTLTVAAIAGVVSANSVHAAPAALVKSVSIVATAKGAAASGSISTLIKGTLKLMAWTKAKTAITAGIIVLLAAGTTTVAVKEFSPPAYDVYFTEMNSGKLWTVPPMVVVRPTQFAGKGSQIIAAEAGPINRLMRRDCQFVAILADAYGYGPERMILPDDLPTNRYDLLLTVPIHPAEVLREELRKGFGLVGHTETREVDALVLRKANNGAIATMRRTTSRSHIISCDPGKLALLNYTMPEFAEVLGGGYFGKPVIDDTGMPGSYDISMRWEGNYDSGWTKDTDWNDQRQMFAEKLREQLGLEVVPARRSIEVLVVERIGHGDSTKIVRKDPLPPAVPQNSWKSVGNDSPAAAFQTFMWAMKAGDLKAFSDCCTPAYWERFMQSQNRGGKRQTDEQIAAGNRHKANEIETFEIVGNKVISDEEEVLYVRAPKHGVGRITMKKINGAWKADEDPH
jgi:uncharacterized protein (TIGR03435 family)